MFNNCSFCKRTDVKIMKKKAIHFQLPIQAYSIQQSLVANARSIIKCSCKVCHAEIEAEAFLSWSIHARLTVPMEDS